MSDETVWRDEFPPQPWLDGDADQTHVQYGRGGLTCGDPRDADEARLWLGYANGGTCVAAYQCDHSGRWVLAGSDLGMIAGDAPPRADLLSSPARGCSPLLRSTPIAGPRRWLVARRLVVAANPNGRKEIGCRLDRQMRMAAQWTPPPRTRCWHCAGPV